MNLTLLGWNDALARQFEPFHSAGFQPGRVTVGHKLAYTLLTAAGELSAECTGRFIHQAATRADFPAVGDWVAVRPRPTEALADIHAVLPRRTTFSRRAAGDTAEEQVVAANVDTVFLVTALDQNFNLRRIERYLTVARDSGAEPVVLLNKTDLHPDPAAARAEVERIAAGAPVVAISATTDVDPRQFLAPWLAPGRTVALLGSSGVGKSTLINRLLGAEQQPTGAISTAVGKGRHTTTRRELIVAPAGFLLLDTPGMRELQLWDVEAAMLDATFADVAALAARCRFRDCTHRAEPDCAVQAALADGTLDFERWQSFQKLQREQAYAARQANPRLLWENKTDWKKLNRQLRVIVRMKRGE